MRLYNLLMDGRAEKFVRSIGNSFGEVLEIDSDGVRWDASV